VGKGPFTAVGWKPAAHKENVMTDLSLLQDFVTETVEHLEEMEGNLLQLETDPGNRDTLNDIFRSVHTIKGASEYLGMARIAELSHKLENLLDLMRHNAQTASREVIDLLMAARDRIGILTADLHQTQTEQAEIEDLLVRIQALDREKSDPMVGEPAATQADPTAISSGAPKDTSANTSASDIYEEEHDEELFGIFLDQLQNGLEALQSWTDALPGADRTDQSEILGRCLGQIDPLHSSANYMGYGKLTTLYDRWDAAIQAARERLDGGNDLALPAFITDTMQANIDEIGSAFPRLKLSGASPQDPTTVADDNTNGFVIPGHEDLTTDVLAVDSDTTGVENGTMIPSSPATNDNPPGEIDLFNDESIEDDNFNLVDESENALDLTLLQEFITETVEHLGEMESNLLQLETDPDNRDILNDIFRSVHTIKGASEYLGMPRIAELSHKLENLLDLMRHNAQTASREVIDLLMAARDRIGILTADLHQTQTEQAEIEDLLIRIQALDSEKIPPLNEEAVIPDTDPSAVTSAFDADVPADASSNAAESEIYEEEHDEELFGIFLEQLQDGLEALQSWTDALPEADRTDRSEILGRCLEQIDPLRSSSNYMGYRQLTALYDRWNDAIRTARERLGGEDENFMPAFIAGCMQATIDDISRCFPRLERPTAASQSAVAGDGGQDLPAVNPDAASPTPSDLLDAYAEAPEITPALDDDPIPASPVPEGDDLFDRLSRSFDHKMAEHHAPLPDTAPSGMELELFSEGHATNFGDPSSTLPDPHETSAEDPLTAYVDAPETPLDELPAEDHLALETPTLPTEITAVDRDIATDEPADETTQAIPPADPEDATAPEALSDDTPEPIHDAPVEEPTTPTPLAEAPQSADTALPSEATNVVTPPAKPSSQALPPAEREERTGDRRNSVQRGRRKSDHISEQLLKQSIRVDAVKIDDLMNQVGELVVSRAWFSQLFHEMRDLQQNLQHHASLESREMKQVKGLTFRLSEATVALGRVANELQEGVMKVRMLPIAQLFNRYPRLVFDLVRDGNKKVNLDIKGEETELDKMVIEAISDPLIHIIRNAVDHGIETSAERKRLGKPESGTINLEAYHEGNHVVIEIADDGRGLDVDRIKAKAISGNFASPEELERMPFKELTGLIMQPGFSTAAEITHTSGRGVGMDVVKQNIEKLNGTLEIDSTPGTQTRFRIKIPLTLAIIPALLVQVRHELFTIPLSTVEETIRIAPEDLSTIEGVEVMQLRETTLPLVRLANLFNMPTEPSGDGRAFVVVVSTGMKRVGLVVDVLLGQEEVVIKPLEDYLQERSGFSGATILGDGRISLILDIYELVNLSINRQAKRKNAGVPV
jgi:two-component system chemotaxis sensor kinase CheA